MNRRTSIAIVGLLCLGLLHVASASLAEPKEGGGGGPAAAGAPGAGEWSVSPMRVTTVPEITYLHTTVETTLAQVEQVVGPEIEELLAAVRENQVEVQGQVLFVYKGVQMDPGKPFKLSIGMPVAPGTPAVGKYEVKDLPPFKCAGLLYQGATANIPAAYQKLFGELMGGGGGHRPTDETREMFLYWEAPDSDRNVVWIQAGLAE